MNFSQIQLHFETSYQQIGNDNQHASFFQFPFSRRSVLTTQCARVTETVNIESCNAVAHVIDQVRFSCVFIVGSINICLFSRVRSMRQMKQINTTDFL